MTRKRLITDNTTPARTLNTKSTGEILRSARVKQGLSVEQISTAINIRPSMLKAIEEGRFFGLTDPLYLKGFIRSYAHQVGLSDDEVLPFFRRDYDDQEHQQQLTQPLAPIQTKKSWFTPGWAIVGFLIIAIIAVTGYAYQQYVSVALTPQLQIDKPGDKVQTSTNQITTTGHTDPDVNLSLNGQPLQLDPKGNFSTTVGLAAGNNQLTFKATNKLGKSITIQRTVISTQPLAQLAAPTIPSASSSANPNASSSATLKDPSATPLPLSINLVIGPAPAWVDITTDGQPAFTGILLPGANQTFTASSRIHIKTGNAGSTRVILKGQDQGTLGPDNQSAERDYTQ